MKVNTNALGLVLFLTVFGLIFGFMPEGQQTISHQGWTLSGWVVGLWTSAIIHWIDW